MRPCLRVSVRVGVFEFVFVGGLRLAAGRVAVDVSETGPTA